MSATVVHAPTGEHLCSPGWDEHFHLHQEHADLPSLPPGWYLKTVRHAPGTVVECACGKTWVALEHLYSGTRVGWGIIHGGWNDYRRETRGERRRRLRHIDALART